MQLDLPTQDWHYGGARGERKNTLLKRLHEWSAMQHATRILWAKLGAFARQWIMFNWA